MRPVDAWFTAAIVLLGATVGGLLARARRVAKPRSRLVGAAGAGNRGIHRARDHVAAGARAA